jgi:hypothetical protein
MRFLPPRPAGDDAFSIRDWMRVGRRRRVNPRMERLLRGWPLASILLSGRSHEQPGRQGLAGRTMKERFLRPPGPLLEGLLFVGGVLVGISFALEPMFRGLAPGDRSRLVSGWAYAVAIGLWVMAAAFQAAQTRQVRRDLLSRRHTGVIGPLVAGTICGSLYVGLCLMEPLFQWLPSMLVLVAGACALSFMGSRLLWKKQSH